jgi:hypothetical protein
MPTTKGTSMKKLIAIAVIVTAFASTSRAQWVVYDPANTVQSVINTAMEIAKYIEMIENQVQQIETLTQQLDEFKHYEDLFGDPKKVLLSMVPTLTIDLRHTETGRNLDDLLTVADGAYALTYNGSGIFHTVGATFTTPGGETITRPEAKYKPYAAVSRTADNYMTVAKDAATRRVALKSQIAQTVEQLKSAPTDAEVQKLQAILASQNSDLASLDAEIQQAVGSALVQDIQNRNDEQKQIRSLREQQNAEFEEAVRNYGQKFQLLNQPTLFPTQ